MSRSKDTQTPDALATEESNTYDYGGLMIKWDKIKHKFAIFWSNWPLTEKKRENFHRQNKRTVDANIHCRKTYQIKTSKIKIIIKNWLFWWFVKFHLFFAIFCHLLPTLCGSWAATTKFFRIFIPEMKRNGGRRARLYLHWLTVYIFSEIVHTVDLVYIYVYKDCSHSKYVWRSFNQSGY